MKKRVGRIVSVVAFLILFCILFLRVSEIFRAKTSNASDMVHTFYDIEEDTLDVLCLGSSHAYYGFQPNVLWNEYGITSCVLGSPQQTAALSYYLLKEALQYQKPEVVLFESYYLWFDQLYTKEERLRQAMDPMRFGTVKMEMVDELLGDLSWKEKFNYYVPFMTYHQRWQELENSDFHSKPYLKGSFMRANVHSMEDLGVAREAVEIPETSLEYLNKMVELCENEGIHFVMFCTPFGVIDSEEGYWEKQGVVLSVEEYAKENNIPFFFFQKTGEAGISLTEDLCDTGHLNVYGAEKCTKTIGQYLSQELGLKSHKGEIGYESWDADYTLYLKDLEAMIAKQEE
ncbi:MAG TPA: hypothetical protein IAB31_11835 [Candidatus Choladousia intestinavium]|uniref:SGNH/GDSL hydrolase family protein n=1 Tax=Candidatus Choladousia intestinavium TaxID=2840727 RepID=A0A9D1ADF7_9FIRM|nr:hypothetical protein [Candidatus Choladousia intestinavium]